MEHHDVNVRTSKRRRKMFSGNVEEDQFLTEVLKSSSSLNLREAPSVVTKRDSSGRVFSLEIKHYDICLPQGMSEIFTNLRKLRFSFIAAYLPPDIWKLPQLECLELSHCRDLDGLIPEIGQLKNLKELRIEG
jgi:hypothetical protein